MKAGPRSRSARRNETTFFLSLLLIALGTNTYATSQLLLAREHQAEQTEYKGIVELTVNPGFDNARVAIIVDGEKIIDGLRSPYRVTVDFGSRALEHKISVIAVTTDKKRVQWHETINRGMLPLSVKLRPVDLTNRVFEAVTTAPADDPIEAVELWDSGQKVASVTEIPYRLAVPENLIKSGFVQVIARTKSGQEAADFWSVTGDVHVESVEVRTVPIFVSVIDRSGNTRADVDRKLFRILDNDAEAKIIEFGKAFDQPISIALLLDASASMTYAIRDAGQAAMTFVRRMLKPGDRCAVYAIRDVPRRQQELTADRALIEKALTDLLPKGQTALFDAIITATRELKNEKNRRAIVVLTDGGDTSSIASYEELENAATEAGIPIYFIAYEGAEPTSPRDIDRLRFLASETGGFLATASQQNLMARYTEIEKDLRAQFAILYQVTDYAKHNEWRRVRVLLASPKLTARTIKGYFAP